MAILSIQVGGISELDAGFEEWQLRIGEAALEWVTKGGQLVADQAKGVFAGGSHDYPWQGPNFPIPTSHSGFLRDSIAVDNIRTFAGGASSETGPKTVYGRRIELGYTGTGHFPYYTTRPFPFLAPAEEKSRPLVADLYERLITEAQEA